ncbi:MAG: type II toxin-antitoxin system VapC family toxin [Sphingomonadaceae bacterium]
MRRVVDTSVALKWVVPERGTQAALAWVGEMLVAPDLIRAELANALWKKVRRGEMSAEQALPALEKASAPLALLPDGAFAEDALAIALELSHPVYDCFFLALASRLNLPLLTADKRLIGACSGSAYAGLLEEVDSKR